MVVQHNIPALNSHRNLGINNTNLSKNLEKLSSGYRINRAADDAAGLAISEKMRAQITGLNRAVMNAQDGASLIQTAEGALQEVHSMLNRLVELATQSANGTIQADDRQKIEAETKALKDEIDRISESTNFNGIKLLDGSLSESGVQEIKIDNLATTFVAPTQTKVDVQLSTASLAGTNTVADGDKVEYGITFSDGSNLTFSFTVDNTNKLLIAKDGSTYSMAAQGAVTGADLHSAIAGELSKDKAINEKYTIDATTSGTIKFAANEPGSKVPHVVSAGASYAGATEVAYTAATYANVQVGADAYKTAEYTPFDKAEMGTEEARTFSVNGVKFAVAIDAESAEALKNRGINVYIETGTAADDYKNLAALINQKTGLNVQANAAGDALEFKELEGSGKALTMQVGDTADKWNKISVSVDDMSSVGIGIAGISMATQESAASALDAIKSAIEKVSVNRGNLGALQNRLEYTINNLNVTSENMTAAESRIRDVDMAKEMMAFTKNNVLSQAAQAMLAQANQQPQQVLQLLR